MKLFTKLSHVFVAVLLLQISYAKAQMPVLKVKTPNTQQEAVKLQKLSIDVQITGNIATTVMTMTFHNNTNEILEGELTFPMPDGVSISRYALDINGKMREAVPVEKAKATEVFESIQRRRVDPGLLEKVEGNNFRTRIYPMPANGSRTIIVGYEEELKFTKESVLSYHLPLAYDQQIPEFDLKTSVLDALVRPELTEQPDGSFKLNATGNNYIAQMAKTNYQPEKGITIKLPKRGDMPEVQMQRASTGYYFLVNVFPKSQTKPRVWSNQIGLIWDASLSGMHRDVKKEMALLDLIVKQKQNLTINLGLLNNTFKNAGTFSIVNGNWDELKRKLEAVVYDGGTNFSALNAQILNADEYVFFTDGLSTFSKNTIAFTKPVHTVNSTQKADYSTLKYISLKTGGQFVNLNTSTVEHAFEQLSTEQLQFLGIKNNTDVRQTYPSMKVNVNGHLAVAGISSEFSTSITLQFGYGNNVVSEQVVRLDPNAQPLASIDVNRIWAQKKIAEMDIQYEQNKDDISVLGKQFGIVTRNTSLIVLEDLNDYLRYDIVPPAELRQQYDAVLKQRSQAILERKNNLIDRAVEMSKSLKTWWNTVFVVKKPKIDNNYPTPTGEGRNVRSETVSAVAVDAMRMPPPVANAAPPPSPRRQADEARIVANREQESKSMLNETVIVGYSSQQKSSLAGSVTTINSQALAGKVAGVRVSRDQTTTVPQTVIVIPEFKSDKAYMKSITGKGDVAYQQYLTLRPQYVSTPTFYFDVANYFYQQADSVRALTILSSVADLELENADIYKLLAYKLKQTKSYAHALFATEKVLQWRPMDAQSYRDYALILADLGQHQKALDYLYKVLAQSYNTQIQGRDQGIEEIVLAELNNLITRYGSKLNTKAIDKRLIQPLPVDVRVVLNWNKNDTDIDLWVTDPNGEKCYYGSPTTAIGGRMSNDFTAGYGPEQFMLKKAIKGKYKIHVNYYGDRQFTISGPTTVTAEIYTRYATGQQQRKIIVLPLEKTTDRERLVGEFTF
ncbi:VIT domain-containing protein [Pedobacter namyangjuensis]|uniref:VIT domain-containing protein n=1 Tax=Pedobacter namyangjuensis TaxID=600626 RepID=UPI000DE56907|nr:VIT domain-containing protein [Pedobacter namyangjuensis]